MLNNCTFIESSIGKGKEVGNFDLVIARDILMCYDKMHHEKVLRWMLYHIALGQFIVFGVKDSIAWTTSRNTIKVVDEEARLFKKVRV
jgi:chemotaxis methyl-accepting protein methylase